MINENPLVKGILSDAQKQASAIIAKAHADADEILIEAQERADKEKKNQESLLALRLEQIKLRTESAVKSVDRLRELRMIDAAYSKVMDRVESGMKELSRTPGFSDILVSWIAEAAIGLYQSEALVSYSQAAPVTEAMLRKAEMIAKEKGGLAVRLSLADGDLADVGVRVSSLDGDISYNNQLGVRIRRYQRDIRRIIQEEYARQNSR